MSEDRDRSCHVRPTLGEAVRRAEGQIETFAFAAHERARVREICFILAEISLLPSGETVRVAGETLEAGLVQEVLALVRHEHVRMVLDNFKGVTARVRNKKAYLRSALYQSVFELEAHYANLVNHHAAGGEES